LTVSNSGQVSPSFLTGKPHLPDRATSPLLLLPAAYGHRCPVPPGFRYVRSPREVQLIRRSALPSATACLTVLLGGQFCADVPLLTGRAEQREHSGNRIDVVDDPPDVLRCGRTRGDVTGEEDQPVVAGGGDGQRAVGVRHGVRHGASSLDGDGFSGYGVIWVGSLIGVGQVDTFAGRDDTHEIAILIPEFLSVKISADG
jgi:hypothetical protein